tara:strand:+ start:1016 stop:1411 length:396 start_codon:yes stop_codon:yes gene_type:complete
MERLVLPTPKIPKTPDVTPLNLKVPSAKIPSFPPIVVPPSDLEAPPGVKAESNTEEPAAPSINIPVIDIPIPLPTTEVVTAATYAAVTAVAATTFAQPLFEKIKKQIQKFLQKKIDKWKENRKKKKDSLES